MPKKYRSTKQHKQCKLKKQRQKPEPKEYHDPEYGVCCFCNGECNPCSQSCGICARVMTMRALAS